MKHTFPNHSNVYGMESHEKNAKKNIYGAIY